MSRIVQSVLVNGKAVQLVVGSALWHQWRRRQEAALKAGARALLAADPQTITPPAPPAHPEETTSMAGRARKPKETTGLCTDPKQITQYHTELLDKEQSRDDAATSVMSIYKSAERIGIHREAFKSARRLAKMSPEKMRDHWRALQAYVPILCDEHLAQPDIFETDEESDTQTRATSEGEGASSGPAELGQESEPRDQADEDDHAEGPENDWGDAAPLKSDADTTELDQAGYTFNAGMDVGLKGEGPEANPHPSGSSSAIIWERGRAKGYADLVASGERPELTPAPAKRSRRTAAEAAAVH